MTSVRARVEGDLVAGREMPGNEGLHAEQVAEWRHRADLAVGKGAAKLRLACKRETPGAQRSRQTLQINLIRCRQHGQRQPIIDVDRNHLREMATRHVGLGRDLLGGKCGRMRGQSIMNIVFVEKTPDTLHGHHCSPGLSGPHGLSPGA